MAVFVFVFLFVGAAPAQAVDYCYADGNPTCTLCPSDGFGLTCTGQFVAERYYLTGSPACYDDPESCPFNQRLNCTTGECVCNTPSYPCGGCSAPQSVIDAACVPDLVTDAGLCYEGSFYDNRCGAFSCPEGTTPCDDPPSSSYAGRCVPDRICPDGMEWLVCSDQCVTPYILREPDTVEWPQTAHPNWTGDMTILADAGAGETGNIDAAGSMLLGGGLTSTAGDMTLVDGDVYLAGGRAVRVDGAGSTVLNMGNWDFEATGLTFDVWGLLDADEITSEGNITATGDIFALSGISTRLGDVPDGTIEADTLCLTGSTCIQDWLEGMPMADDDQTLHFDLDTLTWLGNDNLRSDGTNVAVGSSDYDGKLKVRQETTDDIMNLYDGAAVVMTVLDGGYVGIGEGLILPSHRLTVEDSGNTPVSVSGGAQSFVQFVGGGTPQGYFGYSTDGGGGMSFLAADGSTVDMIVDAFGNVGIGTTTPQTRLDIQPDTNVSLIVRDPSGAEAWSVGYNTTFGTGQACLNGECLTNWLEGYPEASDEGYTLRWDMDGYTAPDGSPLPGWVSSGLLVNDGTRVGIGASPAARLHVSAPTGETMRLQAGDTQAPYITFYQGTAEDSRLTAGDSGFVMSIGGAEKMSLSDGTIGQTEAVLRGNVDSDLGSVVLRLVNDTTANWGLGGSNAGIEFEQGGATNGYIRMTHGRGGGQHSWEDANIEFGTLGNVPVYPTLQTRMILTSNGTLGIGYTGGTAGTYPSNYSLDVAGNGRFVDGIGVGGFVPASGYGVRSMATTLAGQFRNSTSGIDTYLAYEYGGVPYGVYTEGDVIVTNLAQTQVAAYVDSVDARLGLGTDTPGYSVDAVDTSSTLPIVRLSDTVSGTAYDWTGLRLDRGAVGTEMWFAGMTDATDDGFRFRASGTDVVTITQGGSVGVGASLTPDAPLHVASGAAVGAPEARIGTSGASSTGALEFGDSNVRIFRENDLLRLYGIAGVTLGTSPGSEKISLDDTSIRLDASTTINSSVSGGDALVVNAADGSQIWLVTENDPDGPAACLNGDCLNNWLEGYPEGTSEGHTLRWDEDGYPGPAAGWVASDMITNTGTNVGIGTAAPDAAYRLDVDGDVRIVGDIMTDRYAGLDTNTMLGVGPASVGQMANATAVNSTLVGYLAGRDLTGHATVSSGSTFVGAYAGLNVTTGYRNTAVGRSALAVADTGVYNTALGWQAGYAVTGHYNTHVGAMDGRFGTGTGNTAVGFRSNQGTPTNYLTGNYNTALGMDAQRWWGAGSYNVALGYQSGHAVDGTTNASYNTLLGSRTGYALTTGQENVFMGYNSGGTVSSGGQNTLLGSSSGTSLTTGSRNIAIGQGIQLPVATGNDQLNIGNLVYGDMANGYMSINQSGGTAPLSVYQVSDGAGIVVYGYDDQIGSTVQHYVDSLGEGHIATSSDMNLDSGGNVDIGLGGASGSSELVVSDSSGAEIMRMGYDTVPGAGFACLNGDCLTNWLEGYPSGTAEGATLRWDLDGYPGPLPGWVSTNMLTVEETEVGIGTDSPAYRLDVHSASLPIVRLNDTDATESWSGIVISDEGTEQWFVGTNDTNDDLQFRKNESTYLTFTPTGIWTDYTDASSNRNTILGVDAGNSTMTGIRNTLLGYGTGMALTTGNSNVFVGSEAGMSSTTGWGNVVVGQYAGQVLTTQNQTTFIGGSAGRNATRSGTYVGWRTGEVSGGASGTFIGAFAGLANTTGSENTFVGDNAGSGNTTGSYNTFLGKRAGDDIVTGSHNIIVGRNAGAGSAAAASDNVVIGNEAGGGMDGGYNVAIGRFSAWDSTGSQNVSIGANSGLGDGDYNVAVGSKAYGDGASTGSYNVSLGHKAGYNATEGNNIFIGAFSAQSQTTGTGNIAIGYNEDLPSTTGSDQLNIGGVIYGDLSASSIGIGTVPDTGYALHVAGDTKIVGDIFTDQYTNNSTNTLLGVDAAAGGTHVAGWQKNTIIGNEAGYSMNDLSDATIIGYQAGYSMLEGSKNTVIGSSAMKNAGSYPGENVAIGYRAAMNSDEAWYNAYVGTYSGANASGSYNTALGYMAGRGSNMGGSTADGLTAIGYWSGLSLTSGSYNTFVGQESGNRVTSGQSNTLIGYLAGNYISTGSYNTAVGLGAGSAGGLSTGSYNILIGNSAAVPDQYGDYQLSIGNTIYGDLSASSIGIGAMPDTTYTLDVDGTASMTGLHIPTGAGDGYILVSDASGNASWVDRATATGLSGTENYVAKFTSTGLGESVMYDDGTSVGIGTPSPAAVLDVDGTTWLRGDVYTDRFNEVDSITILGVGAAGNGTLAATAHSNTLIGSNSGKALTIGYSNTFVGAESGVSASSGTFNTFLGHWAGQKVTSGGHNTMLGYRAGRDVVLRSGNTFIGSGAGVTSEGEYNTGLGHQALSSSDGNKNVGLGYDAGSAITTGSYNTMIGTEAGDNVTSGSNNIAIGYLAALPSDTGSYQLNIGNTIYGDLSTGRVGIGTSSPAYNLHSAGDVGISMHDAGTNTILDGLVIRRSTSGTAAAGLGSRVNFMIENAGGAAHDAFSMETSWLLPTAGSESSKMLFNGYDLGTQYQIMSLDVSKVSASIRGNEALTAVYVTGIGTAGVGINNSDPKTVLDIDGIDTNDVADMRITGHDALIQLGIEGSTQYAGPHGFAFGDDDGTGGLQLLYRSSPNQLIVEKANDFSDATDLFSIDYDTNYAYFGGRVGIGTASPEYSLDIAGSSVLIDNNTYYRVENTGGTNIRMLGINASNDVYMGAVDNAGGSVYIREDGSTKMTIKDGNVGINTTNPGVQLDVSGQTLITSSAWPPLESVRTTADTTGTRGIVRLKHQTSGDMGNGFGAGLFYTLQDSSGTQYEVAEIGAQRDGADNTGSIYFNTYAAGTKKTRMFIQAYGRVGIGTDSPGEQLHVNRTVADSSTVGAALRLSRDNSTGVGGVGAGVALQHMIENSSEGQYGQSMFLLSQWTNATDGSEDSTIRLNFSLNGASQSAMMIEGNSGHAGFQYLDAASSTDLCYRSLSTSYGTMKFLSTCSSSSRRYKENIRSLDVDIEKVLQLEPVRFDWKKKYEEDEYGNLVDATPLAPGVGLIAEDVLPLLPDLVEWQDGQVESIEYDLLSVYNLAVLKTHNEDLTELGELLEGFRLDTDGRLVEIEGRVQRLEDENDKLKAKTEELEERLQQIEWQMLSQ